MPQSHQRDPPVTILNEVCQSLLLLSLSAFSIFCISLVNYTELLCIRITKTLCNCENLMAYISTRQMKQHTISSLPSIHHFIYLLMLLWLGQSDVYFQRTAVYSIYLLSPHADRHAWDISFTVGLSVHRIFCQGYIWRGLTQGDKIW